MIIVVSKKIILANNILEKQAFDIYILIINVFDSYTFFAYTFLTAIPTLQILWMEIIFILKKTKTNTNKQLDIYAASKYRAVDLNISISQIKI